MWLLQAGSQDREQLLEEYRILITRVISGFDDDNGVEDEGVCVGMCLWCVCVCVCMNVCVWAYACVEGCRMKASSDD